MADVEKLDANATTEPAVVETGMDPAGGDGVAERVSQERAAGSTPLSDDERQALLAREKARMTSADYRQTLADPTAVIEAHLRHHGRK